MLITFAHKMTIPSLLLCIFTLSRKFVWTNTVNDDVRLVVSFKMSQGSSLNSKYF